eukprot:scaffold270_cov207-Alexandrium_tamarense.AAC.27
MVLALCKRYATPGDYDGAAKNNCHDDAITQIDLRGTAVDHQQHRSGRTTMRRCMQTLPSDPLLSQYIQHNATFDVHSPENRL